MYFHCSVNYSEMPTRPKYCVYPDDSSDMLVFTFIKEL